MWIDSWKLPYLHAHLSTSFFVYKLDSNKTFKYCEVFLQCIVWKTWWKLVPKPSTNLVDPFCVWSNLKCFFQSNFGEKMRTFFGESARIIYTMIVHYIRSYHEDSQRTCMYSGLSSPTPPLGEWMNCINPQATGVFEGGMGELLIDSVQIHLHQ